MSRWNFVHEANNIMNKQTYLETGIILFTFSVYVQSDLVIHRLPSFHKVGSFYFFSNEIPPNDTFSKYASFY